MSLPLCIFCICGIMDKFSRKGVFLNQTFYSIKYYFMSRLGNYLRDTASEMKHVTWPTQGQAITYTFLVIIVSTVVALFLGGFDFIFTHLLNLIIK